MFADNNQISWRQLFCQMTLGILGAVILFLPGKGGIHGIPGVIASVIACLLLILHCFWMVRIAPVYGHLEKYVGRGAMQVTGMLFLGYFILTGAFLVSLVWQIILGYMISDTSQMLVHAVIILACAMAGIPQIQRRGRLAEFSFPFLIGVLILMIILAFAQNRGDFTAYLMQEFYMDVDTLLGDVYTILAAFTCISAVPFLLGNVKDHRFKSLSGAVVLIFLLFIAILILLQGSYGTAQIEARQWPVLSIMTSIRIPGGFVSRMDPVWLSLLMLFLLFSIGSTFFYSNYIAKKTELKISWYVIYALVYVVSLVQINGTGVGEIYMITMQYFFTPAIFLWNIFLAVKGRRHKA